MRDRDLVRLYWPVATRAAFAALFAIDDTLGGIVAGASQPTVGAIRLAWWREALERLDHAPPPPEPRLQDVATELIPRGVSGTDLAGLEAGWATLLDETPLIDLVAGRGAILFDLAARVLGVPSTGLAEAGALFAINDAARRGLLARSAANPTAASGRFARGQRPVTALATLAARDARRRDSPWETEATPGRALALFVHRLTGRLP